LRVVRRSRRDARRECAKQKFWRGLLRAHSARPGTIAARSSSISRPLDAAICAM
jgi:hypothetical protein